MNIVNTPINTPVLPSKNERPAAQSSRDQFPVVQSAPRDNTQTSFDAQALEKRGAELAKDQVQSLSASSSASLKTQQALNAYQQTERFSQEFDQGELVGLDLFV